MAIFTAYMQVNMDATTFANGNASILNATHIQIKSGLYVQNYYGSFSYNGSGDLVGGTLTSTDLFYNGGKVYALTGGSYNVVTVKNYVESLNAQGLLQYLFAGNDQVNGSPFADILNGYAGNDTINGNGGNDALRGGIGNDLLNGGTGADNMAGGDGSDIYYVDNALDTVTETNANSSIGGVDTVLSYLSNYTLKANVEYGRIVSSGLANLTGNTLNNVLHAGAGNNQIDGSVGSDAVSFAYATTTGASGVTLNLSIVNASGQSTATGISGTDLVKNIESIIGSNYADILGGNNGSNALFGGAGNDFLLGGLGNDTLNGGAGKDYFRFNTAPNNLTNKDTLLDFNPADDTIQLENGIFTKLATVGALSAGNFRASNTGTAADANDFVLYNTATGTLSYDADGNAAGAAVQIATVGVSIHPALTFADFIVV